MIFKFEQISICPYNPDVARELLSAMGISEWNEDHVVAVGTVHGRAGVVNEADHSTSQNTFKGQGELEILSFTRGENWLDYRAGITPRRVSHVGMYCSEEELEKWRNFFAERDIDVAQEVWSDTHTDKQSSDKGWCHYVIFDTYDILSVDIKFIVRCENKSTDGGLKV